MLVIIVSFNFILVFKYLKVGYMIPFSESSTFTKYITYISSSIHNLMFNIVM